MKSALVFASVFSIALLVFFARSIEPRPVEDIEGETGFVEFSGWVASVTESNGHYFVVACAKECVSLAVFRGQADRLRERSLDLRTLRKGQRVSFVGVSDGSDMRCLNEYCIEVLS